MTAAKPYDGPHRRLRLELELEADDLEALVDRLRIVATDLEMRRRERLLDITSAGFRGVGYTAGHHYTLTCDPDMTGDRYRDQLAAWARNRKQRRKAAS